MKLCAFVFGSKLNVAIPLRYLCIGDVLFGLSQSLLTLSLYNEAVFTYVLIAAYERQFKYIVESEGSRLKIYLASIIGVYTLVLRLSSNSLYCEW
jgi:hypothetical protein